MYDADDNISDITQIIPDGQLPTCYLPLLTLLVQRNEKSSFSLPNQVPHGNFFFPSKLLSISGRFLLIEPEESGQSVIKRNDWWV